MKTGQRETFRYTPLFCEENIWWLARDLIENGIDRETLDVVFFINPSASVLLFHQRTAKPDAPIVWDYHVVLRAKSAGGDVIYDFDTRLPFPASTTHYMAATFGDQTSLPAHFRTWARAIPAARYLAHFYSDRSHMIDQIPASTFPDYPIIQPDDGISRMSLHACRDMGSTEHALKQAVPAGELLSESRNQRNSDKACSTT